MRVTTLSLLPLLAVSVSANPGRLLSTGGLIERPGDVLASSIGDDGTVVLSGLFYRVGDLRVPGVVRLRNDGTVDTDFVPEIGIGAQVPELTGGGPVPCPLIVPWDDGSEWGGGVMIGDPPMGVAFLEPGPEVTLSPVWFVLDRTGNVQAQALTAVEPNEPVMPQYVDDGKLVAIVSTGNAAAQQWVPRLRRLRLDTGSDDAGFVSTLSRTPKQALPAPGGGMWVLEGDAAPQSGTAQPPRVVRLSENGTVLSSTDVMNAMNLLAVPDGEVAAVTERLEFEWSTWSSIWRRELHYFTASGAEEVQVLPANTAPVLIGSERSLLLSAEQLGQNAAWPQEVWHAHADGTRVEGSQSLRARRRVQRMADGGLLADGTKRHLPGGGADPAWTEPEVRDHGIVRRIHAGTGGMVYGTGDFTHVDGAPRPGIARWTAEGTLDAAFAPVLEEGETVNCAPQPDGRVIVLRRLNGVASVLRLLADGSVDPSFVPNGFTAPAESAVQGPGGMSYQAQGGVLRRYFPDGRADVSFCAVKLQRRNESITAGMPLLSAQENGGPANALSVLRHPATGALWVAGDFTRVDGSVSPGLAILSAEVPNEFSAWIAAAVSDPAQRSAEADADGDGLSNWREYATGTDPSRPDAGAAAAQILTTAPLCISAPLNPLAAEVVQSVEVSTDMQEWRTAAGGEAVRKTVNEQPAFELASATGPRFVRIRYRSLP